jgi:hypothetical protein
MESHYTSVDVDLVRQYDLPIYSILRMRTYEEDLAVDYAFQ